MIAPDAGGGKRRLVTAQPPKDEFPQADFFGPNGRVRHF